MAFRGGRQRRELVPVRRVPDDPFPGGERVRCEYTSGLDVAQPGYAPILEQHKVFMSTGHDGYLVRAAADECRGRLGRRGQSRVLQRERSVLEDPVGAEHRRIEHVQPDASDLQGDALR